MPAGLYYNRIVSESGLHLTLSLRPGHVRYDAQDRGGLLQWTYMGEAYNVATVLHTYMGKGEGHRTVASYMGGMRTHCG